MTIRQAFSRLRLYIGWADINEERLTPAHGWLLPTPSTMASLPADDLSNRDPAAAAPHTFF
jgi:hypothetical protein